MSKGPQRTWLWAHTAVLQVAQHRHTHTMLSFPSLCMSCIQSKQRPGLREAGRAGCRYSWEPLQTKTNAVFLAQIFRVKAAGCTHHSQGRGMVLGAGSCPALAEGLSPLNHLNSNLSLWAPVSLTLFGRTHLLYVMENQPEERFQVLSAISGERRG